jgi:aminoglycoside phosphotransferase (APT) family kinase protein
MDEARLSSLVAWLKRASGTDRIKTATPTLLSGGAIQQNWEFTPVIDGVVRRWVLRTDAVATLAGISRSRVQEYRLLRAAHEAGVTVPEPLFLCEDPSVIGAPFFIMRRIDGIAAGFRVAKSETLGGGRETLVATLGRELARIHAIRPPRPDLGFLEPPAADPAARFVANMRSHLDDGRLPRPALEWGLRALERTAPMPGETVLCHNDFRTGNFMVSETGITGILDWEFAAWGDPHEDLGWLCAKCWRFGGPGEVGGIGPREPFYAAYEAESGRRVDPARVAWWEIAATIRWAVIAIAQAERHVAGREPGLELALTGHIVPELELDVLRATTGRGT